MEFSRENLFSHDADHSTDGEKLFSDEREELQAASQSHQKNGIKYWNVLVVDDEEDIHSVTRMSLKGFVHLDREINFLHAYSGAEAKQLLMENQDIALILLDVVMENNHAGLDVVKFVRNELKNHMSQIILRTGYPGQAPEREVIVSHEINDYKTKTELTAFKLFTVTLAGIRAYNSLKQLDDLRRKLEDKVQERTLELEKKNMRIMEMDQMKTRFFSNISHELRTPLTLINGPLEDMLMSGIEDETERDKVEMMYRNGLRILGLINQLMDLSKIDAGSLKLDLVEYNVIKVLKMIARSFIPLSERKNIQYRMEIPSQELQCYFDYDKLEKIFTNLLSNAFKFTGEGGQVVCRVKILDKMDGQPAPGIEISVEDSGAGIPQDQVEKIFDRFYQVEGSWKHSSGGTGIGLSLTKELVDLMHGTIQVNSSQSGSTFRLEIPTGKKHLKKQEYNLIKEGALKEYPLLSKTRLSGSADVRAETIAEDENDTNKTTVLIIDDNEDIRQHIKDSLGKEYQILEAANGKEGLNLAKKYVPNLLILDWMMPEMDGIEVCKAIKESELTSHIPVLMLTAKADMENKLEGLETGADDYITKPFNRAELCSRVRNLIVQRKKLLEKFGKNNDFEPKDVAVNSADERFLVKAKDIIERNMGDCDFDVNTFYPEMGMSRMQLFRKIKATTNQTPSELIRNYRLKHAARLLEKKFGNIAEVTYEVGFNNLSYFAKCFKEKYGISPSGYLRN